MRLRYAHNYRCYNSSYRLLHKQMKPVTIPITISPHTHKGKPVGYYIIATRLFPKGNPPILRRQFVGVGQNMVITVGRDNRLNSVLKLQTFIPKIGEMPVTWLSGVKLYPINMGFRVYIPGRVWKPKSAEDKRIQTIGEFKRYEMGAIDLFYLSVPKITNDILLEKGDLR